MPLAVAVAAATTAAIDARKNLKKKERPRGNRKEATRRCSYSNTHLPFAATGRDFHFHLCGPKSGVKVAPKQARVQDKFI